MRWAMSHRFDQRAVAVADRHYSRQKPGTSQFMPPGRALVFILHGVEVAVWGSTLQKHVLHQWPQAWVNSFFRNESSQLSSELIIEAEAATRFAWGDPPLFGFITFVDPTKVRSKRDPGYCYLAAGWRRIGETRTGLHVLQRRPEDAPVARPAIGYQLRLGAAS